MLHISIQMFSLATNGRRHRISKMTAAKAMKIKWKLIFLFLSSIVCDSANVFPLSMTLPLLAFSIWWSGRQRRNKWNHLLMFIYFYFRHKFFSLFLCHFIFPLQSRGGMISNKIKNWPCFMNSPVSRQGLKAFFMFEALATRSLSSQRKGCETLINL